MLLSTEREKDGISKDSRSYKDHFTVQITEPYGNSWQGHIFGPLGGGSWTCQGGLPSGPLCGLSDGEKDHWNFLKSYLDTQLLDFWHATGYLRKTAEVMFQGEKTGPSGGEMA